LNEIPSASERTSPAPPVATVPQNGFDPAFAKLLQELSDPDVNVRLRAVKALEELHLPNTECVRLLTACLSDSDPRIRAYAALRLGSFRFVAIDAVPTLKQLAQTEPDEVVLSRVKDALYNIRMYDYSPFMRDL
jgi:HEAT repeat protein